MANEMDSPSFMQTIIDRLRSHPPSGPSGPQLRGWQLANQEHKAAGEPPETYEEWVKSATPLPAQRGGAQ